MCKPIVRRTTVLTALSLAVVLALSACTRDGSTSNSDNAPDTEGNSTASNPTSTEQSTQQSFAVGKDPTRQPPAPPIPGAKPGGTLTVLSSGGGPLTMDPTDTYSRVNTSVLTGLITRSLTQKIYDPDTGLTTLIPDLAIGLGKPNKDFTKWTFTLRKGIKYENGQPVKPADFKFAIERSFDRSTFSMGPSYSNNFFLDGDSYTGPYGKDKGKNYKGVIIHGNRITIKMARSFPGMPYYGAFPAMSPIPNGSISKPTKYKAHPLATGPYKIKRYEPQHSMLLVKNRYWDPETDPGRHQYIDKIKFTFDMPQSKIDQIMLQDQGEAQSTITLDGNVLNANYANFKSQDPDRLVTGPLPCTWMYQPDNRKITDVQVRRAIGWAVPYRDLIVASGGIPGVTTVKPHGLTPPGVPGREKRSTLADHQPWTTNSQKARSLLKEAGALGQPLRFVYKTDDPNSVQAKNVLVEAFKKAGFDPKPVAAAGTRADQLVYNPDSKLNLRSATWCPDWPAMGNLMLQVLHSTNIAKNGFAQNFEAFNSKRVDQRMAAILRMPLEKQALAWNELEQNVMQKQYPIIPLGYPTMIYVRGSKVHGFHVDPFSWGGATWKLMWLG